MSPHTSALGEDQQGPRFHVEPIKLTGWCFGGPAICLRSHYKHTSTSWSGPPHHYSTSGGIPRSLIWQCTEKQPARPERTGKLRWSVGLPVKQRWWLQVVAPPPPTLPPSKSLQSSFSSARNLFSWKNESFTGHMEGKMQHFPDVWKVLVDVGACHNRIVL